MIAKLLNLIKSHQYHLFLALCIGLISFTSYNLGKVSSEEQKPLKITQNANIYKASFSAPEEEGRQTPEALNTPKPLDMRVVVSKASDSKKYHYSWCGSWKKIKLENQVWFNTEQEAIAAGYTLAGNCSK